SSLAIPDTELPGWRSVYTGVSLQLYAHLLYLGGMLFFFLLRIVTWSSSDSKSGPGEGVVKIIIFMALVAMLSIMGNWILSVVASAFSVLAPTPDRTRGLAVAGLAISMLLVLQMAVLFRVLEGPMASRHADHGSDMEAFGAILPLG